MSEGAANRFDYGYDDNSNPTSLTFTAGAVSNSHGYTYDTLDQVIALSRNSSDLIKFVYDERGNIISAKYSNGTYTAYEYDADNRLTLVKNYNGAGEVLDSSSYTYDANGNRTSVVTASGTINYQYDELNRLTQETLLDGTTITYEYDAVGNRTKKIVGSTITNYTYDNGNQLTNVNGQAYTYDVNGNLTSNGLKTFIYNEVNQLIEVKNTGGSTIATFTYDDQGKRISMTASGTTTYFHYSGDKVIYETDGSNNIAAEYTWDNAGNPVSMTKNGVTYYYHLNGHGDVMELTDANGAVVAQYQYDAWGNILSQSGTMASANPYRYAGYRYDESTGLYYLMARYYDAGVGRFITRDSFHGFENSPSSLNQYAYCENNPVMYVDPSGYLKKKIDFGFSGYVLIETGWTWLKLTINITPGMLMNVGIGVAAGSSVGYAVGRFISWKLEAVIATTAGATFAWLAKKVSSKLAGYVSKKSFGKFTNSIGWMNKTVWYYAGKW